MNSKTYYFCNFYILYILLLYIIIIFLKILILTYNNIKLELFK